MSRAAGRAATGPGDEPAVRIDRLTLRVPGLDEPAARSLARLVAEGLAPALLRSAAGAGLDHLRIEVTAGAADQGSPALLARRISSELARALARGQADGGPAGPAGPGPGEEAIG